MAESRTPEAGSAPGVDVDQQRPRSDWARQYPPLVTILIALVLAIAVLPSALNLPQTNPTQTLEYAPVPPEESDDPPPAGNLSSLGLGSSSGVAEDAEGGGGPGPGATPPPLPGGKGVNPSTKRCVGNPPRQTEDPTSPPCVAFFDGDNFGATYQGVTAEEIRILVYMSGNVIYTSSSNADRSPTNEYFDLAEPAKDNEFLVVQGLRGWQRYFNDRFQTYGRFVHFFAYFDSGNGSPESRRSDAADNFAQVRPFAVLTDVPHGGNESDYVREMARRGVLNFGTLAGKSQELFREYPKLIWGFDPTIEYQAKAFSSYVCSKVVGKPAVLAGLSATGDMRNRPRKLGLVHTTNDNHADRIRLAEMVQQQVEACGGEIAATATFADCCYVYDTRGDADAATTNMAQFSNDGITTILWPGGMEGYMANAAAAQRYEPEWIVLGDDLHDGNEQTRRARNGPAFHNRAILITPEVYSPAYKQQRCYQAYREADQSLNEQDLGAYVCGYYRNLFQLFVGIQVAGPRLGPTSVDKGYHAIPPSPSKDNQSPSCFYDPGDYTCVKDNQIEIWDNQEAAQDTRAGCWRIISDGARYFPGEYPEGNIDSNLSQIGPCNNYSNNGNPGRA